MKVSVSIVLAIAVIAVSTSAPLIRGAQSFVPEAGLAFSLFIAAARMTCASLIMVGPAWVSRRGVTRKALLYTVLAGLFLGLHFGLWIGSLAFTSVAASVTLVTTNPLWVALIGTFLFGDRLSRRVWIGILVAVSGSVIIGLSDMGEAGTLPLLGDAMALLGAVTVSCTLILGKKAQALGAPTLFYIGVSNIVAALVLLPIAAVFGVEVAQVPIPVWFFVLAMALIPQMIGHGAIAWSLTKVSASLVALVVLFEPFVAGLLAWAIFDEVPGIMVLLGAVVVLSGVFVVLTDKAEKPRQ